MSQEGSSGLSELVDIPLYRRGFGDESDLSKPLSETVGFRLYFLASTVILFVSGLWIATQGRSEFPVSRVSAVTTLVVSVSILVIGLKIGTTENPIESLLAVFIAYIVLANIGRWVILRELQAPFVGLTLIQAGSLGLLLIIFSQPILPKKLSSKGISNVEKRRDALKIHLGTQWKVGQIALTVTVLTIGGILAWTFPNGGQQGARVRLIISALSVVVTLGPVLGYVVRKVFLIEQEILESY